MEKVAVALGQSESVLLVGDTGTGKTALVQHIAKMVRCHLFKCDQLSVHKNL